MTSFVDLKLINPLLRAVKACGYTTPTLIQERAIPPALDGSDIMGCAQTGTGKTAAFALPILQYLHTRHGDSRSGHPRRIRALILAPTRELAQQIGDAFADYGRYTDIRHTTVFGGVSQQRQTRDLRRGVDIVVATPGRLLDLKQQGFVAFRDIDVLVLDEADRMLDMGFIPDVRRIVSDCPRDRQTMFFSATLPYLVGELAKNMLYKPVQVSVTPAEPTPETIEQAVYFVERRDKRALLEHFLDDPAVKKALVFTRTKRRADRVERNLNRGRYNAGVIHGDKSQGSRERALHRFRRGQTRILIATDVVARGLDVEGISHVVNFDLPHEPENYVHRIGRTGRASATGKAISFCGVDERAFLVDIEKQLKMRIPVVEEHPYKSVLPPPSNKPAAGRRSVRRWTASRSRRAGRVGRPTLRVS